MIGAWKRASGEGQVGDEQGDGEADPGDGGRAGQLAEHPGGKDAAQHGPGPGAARAPRSSETPALASANSGTTASATPARAGLNPEPL